MGNTTINVPENITTTQSFQECLDDNFGKTIVDCSQCYNIRDTPKWLLSLHACVTGFIVIISLVGCFLVMLLILKFKKLRHRTAIISLSIIATDVVLIVSYHLPVFVSSLSEGWIFMFSGCQAFGFISSSLLFTRWFNMGVLALDRFCAVRFPFSYPKFNRCIMILLLTMSWIVPLLINMGVLTGYSSVSFRDNVPTCIVYAPQDRGIVFYSLIFAISFGIGGVLPTILYLWLFKRARRLSPAAVEMGRVNGIQNSSNPQNGDNSRHETRAIVTFALIFVTFSLTGLPIFLFQLLRSLSIRTWCQIPQVVHFIAIEIFFSSTALDPFLVMRDRDYRKRLKHLLLCHNNCGRYYPHRASIHSRLPAERDFDALRTITVRALNLISLPNNRNEFFDSVSDNKRPFRPRSGSAPPQYPYLPNKALKSTIIHDTIEEIDESQVAEDRSCGSNPVSCDDTEEIQTSYPIIGQVISTVVNDVECMEVRVKFA